MLSTQIKEVSKEAHLNLEKKVVRQLKAIRSNEDYARLLKYFYSYFNNVEKAIAPFVTEELLPDYKERRNSSHIKKDIETLGGTIDELPQASVPEIKNHLHALGALYVMEGSIMGGKIIVQMLAKGGITEGVSFFSGYGEETPAKWSVFTEVLNSQGATEEQRSAVVESALHTFEHFSNTFGDGE